MTLNDRSGEEAFYMTGTEDEQLGRRVPYGGDYEPVESIAAPKAQLFKVAGGYSELERMVADRGSLGMNSNDILRVEAALAEMTPDDRKSLCSAVGAFLGDSLCSQHPDVQWESLGAGRPVVRLTSKTTWDVHAYIESSIESSPHFMSKGIAEMERLLVLKDQPLTQ